MTRYHPSPCTQIAISIELNSKLAFASLESDFKKEPWEIAGVAINEWLARNSPDEFGKPSIAGYQWKHVFLPNGTLLRTIFNGKNYSCMVEGDIIRFNGQITSPSRFANAVGGTRRNAWKTIWVLFPNTSTWVLAGTLRHSNVPPP